MEKSPLTIHPGHGVEILDQTLLPLTERWLMLQSVEAVCEAIRSLRVRGAPLLGLAGAGGLAIAGMERGTDERTLITAADEIIATRPTAVDLGAVTRRALAAALDRSPGGTGRADALWGFALAFAAQREEEDRALSGFGAALLPPGAAVLTHCNTGAMATGGIGTALGVIRTAWERGLLREVYATETRPLLQGARLTMWELDRAGIPATLVPDTAAASLIASGRVGAVITGADRVAANGDTANKVGTFGLAVMAERSGIPFFIAAPTTTIDLEAANGAAIPIEFRPEDEVGGYGDLRFSPPGTRAWNPAFDVTPGELIRAIVTEVGVVSPPYGPGLAAVVRAAAR